MLNDLPDDVVDEFGLHDSTLDGPALVTSKQIDAVRSRLLELGFEFE